MKIQDMKAIQALLDRHASIQHGGAPRILIAFDVNGVHVREVQSINHLSAKVSVSGTPEVHYETRVIATGPTLGDAVASARAGQWKVNDY